MIVKDENTSGIDTILQHGLSNNSALFDGDLMTKVNNKSQLISELENYLQELDYLHDSFEHQAVKIDVVCCQINKNKQKIFHYLKTILLTYTKTLRTFAIMLMLISYTLYLTFIFLIR